jgi:hypothetical protein
MSPSSLNGLDSRRIRDIRPRDPRDGDLSGDSLGFRIRHERLACLLGEAEATQAERALYLWRKQWDAQPLVTEPWPMAEQPRPLHVVPRAGAKKGRKRVTKTQTS